MNRKPKSDLATTTSSEPAKTVTLSLVLSVPEFGDRYGMKKTTIYKWICSGMPHLKINQKKTRIPVVEADRWVRDNFFRMRES